MRNKINFPTAEEFIEAQAREFGVPIEQMILHHITPHSLFGTGDIDIATVQESFDMAKPADKEAFKRVYDEEVAALKRNMKKKRARRYTSQRAICAETPKNLKGIKFYEENR